MQKVVRSYAHIHITIYKIDRQHGHAASTGNSTLYSVITCMGRELVKYFKLITQTEEMVYNESQPSSQQKKGER